MTFGYVCLHKACRVEFEPGKKDILIHEGFGKTRT